MVERCSWCGKALNGNVVAPGGAYYAEFDGGEKPDGFELEVGFCCHGCAWAWWVEEEKLFGLDGGELRQHLIEEHGLVHPPGSPGGKESQDCIRHFYKIRGKIERSMSFQPEDFTVDARHHFGVN